jgi:hypoxanthine-DNA glycosylase
VRKASFGAVVDERTRLLVLGSLPGEASLAQGRYYAHPQNQFWRLMQTVTGAELVDAPYPDRLARLLSAGVGLWDVVGSALRQGSLDAAIREHEPNGLRELVEALPALRAVAFNGGTAFRLGRAVLDGVPGVELVALPSSSPAYTLAFERKLEAWTRLREFLRD